MATPAQITALKQLYTGIFGFLPTTEAFDWYVAQIDRLGLDTAGLANVLLYDDTQAGASNTFDYNGGDTVFVRQVYQNLFGWTDTALALPEHVEGVAYWTEQLNGVFGGDKGKLIEAMIWVVETTGLNSPDISTQQAFALLQNYLEVSTYALEQAKAAGEDLDLDVLRSAYDVVTGNAASVDEAKTLIDTRGKAIYGTDAGETLNGTYRNDAILGLTGDDVINAGAGNDWINTGASGNNVVTAGKGNDQIEGGPGNEIYIFNRGDGQDVLFDHGGNDTLQLNGIAAADVTLARQGDDLVLSVKGSADKITVYSHFANENYAIDAVRFADSVVWDKSDISNAINGGGQVIQGTDGDEVIQGTNGDDTLSGGAGNDKLYGEAGADTLSGGKGNDTLEGGAGNDTYQFSRGDGQDTILDRDEKVGNKDTLQFVEGIAPQDVFVTRSNDDLVLIIEGSDDQIVVKNHFSSKNYAIEEIQFANGAVWDKPYIDNAINGGGQAIHGTSGDDTLYGGATNDTLNGGDGDDVLYGGAGADTLNGGKGNDTLDGGSGNDVYQFARGDGQDTIVNFGLTAGNKDTLQFTVGITPEDVEVARSDYDLVLGIKGSGDQITIKNYFANDSYVIEAIQFANGKVWGKSEINHAISSGAKTILEGAGGNDDLYADEEDNILNGFEGNDLLLGRAGDDDLYGGPGDDRLYGEAGSDRLDGGQGNDYLEGGAGNDIYLFARGDGRDNIWEVDPVAADRDVIRFAKGIAPSDVRVSRVDSANHTGSDLLLSINGGADQIRVNEHFLNGSRSIEAIEFDDGTVWDKNYIWNNTDIVGSVLDFPEPLL